MINFNKCRWDFYYEMSKEIYKMSEEPINDMIDLYDLTVIEHNNISPVINVETEEYKNIIKDLSKKVDEEFKNPKNYTYKGRANALNNIWSCKEALQRLGEYIVPQMEQNVFKSYVQVDNIKIYRSPVSTDQDTSSWLWHFDNNPKEQIKILIYLTDVDVGCGEFTYLLKSNSGIKVPTSRVSWDDWSNPWDQKPSSFLLREEQLYWAGTDRVPPQIIETLKREHSYQAHSATGERGTLFLFDNNIIHKATIPKKKPRDVIVMQFKPSIEKICPYINENNTGNGFEHTTFNVDPSVLEVVPATPEYSNEEQLKKIRM